MTDLGNSKTHTELLEKAKAEARWAINRWCLSMTSGELVDAIFDGPCMRALISPEPLTPAEKLAAWAEYGPRLAKEAGCHVGIRITEPAHPSK